MGFCPACALFHVERPSVRVQEDEGGLFKEFAIEGGYVQVSGTKVIILVDMSNCYIARPQVQRFLDRLLHMRRIVQSDFIAQGIVIAGLKRRRACALGWRQKPPDDGARRWPRLWHPSACGCGCGACSRLGSCGAWACRKGPRRVVRRNMAVLMRAGIGRLRCVRASIVVFYPVSRPCSRMRPHGGCSPMLLLRAMLRRYV
ncbi:MAG: hypothetical protein ACLT98_13040 [Eggerthellaceae bacterium]